MTLAERAARFVRNRRRRRGVLAASAVASLVGASVTLAAVVRPGPIVLMLFLLVAQPAIVVAVVLYAAVAVIEFLAERGVSEEAYSPGETIFREGDRGDRMYAVLAGEVEVFHEEPDGRVVVIATLEHGQYFGEMALIGNAPRVASARAVGHVRVAALGHEDFETLYANLPDFHRSIERMLWGRRVWWRRTPPPSS
jgi:cyclic nucleotide-binding protein